MMYASPQHDISETLRAMTPHCQRLMTEMRVREKYADLAAMLGFCDLMSRWGVNPDPYGIFRGICASMAGGPEISVEEAIRLRQSAQPKGELNLSGLQLSDQDLALIDVNLNRLCLVDTSITDAGVGYLLTMKSLKQVNIAGTRVSDSGLAKMAALEGLKWVCVNRTLVSDSGVELMKNERPDITVLIGSEP